MFLLGFPNNGEERSVIAPRSQRPRLWIHEQKLHWKYEQFLYRSTLAHFYFWIWGNMFLFVFGFISLKIWTIILTIGQHYRFFFFGFGAVSTIFTDNFGINVI